MEQPGIEQLLHDNRNAADFIEILRDIFAARLEVADVRRPAENLGDIEKIEIDPDLVRHRRKMQRAVGRAACLQAVQCRQDRRLVGGRLEHDS